MAEAARAGNGKFVKQPIGGVSGTPSGNEPNLELNINGASVVNPEKIGGTGDGGSQAGEPEKRKRGRQPGFSPNKDKQKETLALDGLNAILYSMHIMLAGLTRVPELVLSEDESKRLADAAAKVAVHYNIAASEKQMAWFNLAMCGGSIYGGKFFAYSARMKDEKKNKQPQNNSVENPPVQEQPVVFPPTILM